MVSQVTLYGAPWCPDCKRSKKFLAEHRVPFRWVAAFIFIGLDPSTAFLRGMVELDRWGFVTTDGYQTSMAGVFCAGDVRAGSTKQLGSAVGEGIAALLEVRRFLEAHRQIPAHSVND